MTKPLNEFHKKMGPEVQAVAHTKAIGIVAEMSLAKTRKLRGRSQAMVALGTLCVNLMYLKLKSVPTPWSAPWLPILRP